MAKKERADSDPLPFIQFDRAVMAKAALLAQRIGTSVQHAMGSLVSFWSICGDPRDLQKILANGRHEVVLPADVIRLRFQVASDRDLDPRELEVLGLLEARGDDFRVRGMSRFFGAIESMERSRAAGIEGGKKSAELRQNGTEIQGAPQGAPQGGGQGGGQGAPQPESNQTSDVRRQTASSKSLAGAEEIAPARLLKNAETNAPRKKPVDPRLTPLAKALEADFERIRGARYKHGGPKDTLALKALLPVASDEEIRRRWCTGLQSSDRWACCATYAQLGSKWNDLAKVPATQGADWRAQQDFTRAAPGSHLVTMPGGWDVLVDDGQPDPEGGTRKAGT